jgi:hypothetical protein
MLMSFVLGRLIWNAGEILLALIILQNEMTYTGILIGGLIMGTFTDKHIL